MSGCERVSLRGRLSQVRAAFSKQEIPYAPSDMCRDDFMRRIDASISEIYVAALTARSDHKVECEGERFRQ
jgi:hypothetical protein